MASAYDSLEDEEQRMAGARAEGTVVAVARAAAG